MTSTRFMEDPTGITRVIHYEVSDEDAQAQRRDYAALDSPAERGGLQGRICD